MRLKPWQKTVWWILLTGILSFYLYERLEDLRAGHSAPIDVFVFLIWAALLLAPLFTEVNFFGLKLKQELEETRRHISHEISAMENRIQNSVAVNPQFNIGAPAPPPDSQLPALSEKLDKILTEITQKSDSKMSSHWQPHAVNDKVEYLFRTRLQIETELRRLHRELTGSEAPRVGALQLLPKLVSAGIIANDVAIAAREVYSVCSPAIHGESVSDAKVDFVSKIAPQLILGMQMTRVTP